MDLRTKFVIKTTLEILIGLATVIICAATLMGFLARLWWRFALFSHFRVQYTLASAGLALIWLIIKRIKLATLTSFFGTINLLMILPLYLSPAPRMSNDQKIKVFFANVHTANPYHEVVRELITEVEPELIILLEVNQSWLNDLLLIDEGYSHFIAQPREDNFGIALYSRFPLLESRIEVFGRHQLPSVFAQINLNERLITIIGTHPPPPTHPAAAEARNQQVIELAQFVTDFDSDVILLGDLNMSSWSPYFTDFLMRSGLRDSRLGFGVQPTWPADNLFLQIPLDHVLVSRQINILDRYIGPDIGSDHLPIILEIATRVGDE